MNAKNLYAFPATQEPSEKPNRAKRKNQYGDGRYCSRVTITRQDGSKYQKPFYGKTATEARDRAKAYKQRLGKVKDSEYLEMTIDNLIKMYLPTVLGESRSNDDMYLRMCKKTSVEMGSERACDVRKMHIATFLASFKSQSKSQIAKAVLVTKSLFAFAAENELIDRNPTMSIKAEGGTYTGHRALEDWEQSLIFCIVSSRGIFFPDRY